MMIHLDNEPVTLEIGETPDLQSVLTAARDHLAPAGRVVVEVSLDGQHLAGADLERHQQTAVDGAEVRLESADTRQIAAQALDDIRQVLAGAKQDQDRAADLLQRDQLAEAMQALATAFEAWQQVQQVIHGTIRLVGMEVDAFEFEGRSAAEHILAAAEQLKQTKELIQNGDTVGLSDALAYEWPQIVDLWDRMIAWMALSVRDGAGNTAK